jgi:hypothetical protein
VSVPFIFTLCDEGSRCDERWPFNQGCLLCGHRPGQVGGAGVDWSVAGDGRHNLVRSSPPKRRPSSPSATPSPPTTRRPAHHAQAGDGLAKQGIAMHSLDRPLPSRLWPLGQRGSHHALTAIKDSSHGSRAYRALCDIPHVANHFITLNATAACLTAGQNAQIGMVRASICRVNALLIVTLQW